MTSRLLKFALSMIFLRWFKMGKLAFWLIRLGIASGALRLGWRFIRGMMGRGSKATPPARSGWAASPSTLTWPSAPEPVRPAAPAPPESPQFRAPEPASAGITTGSAASTWVSPTDVEIETSAAVSREPEPESTPSDLDMPQFVRGDGGIDCPAGFSIKGKQSSRIYHQPGDSNFASTVPDICFATEAAAIAAGYRPPKRAQRPPA